ncbi:hypothetical protein TNCV_2295001 [Trichonephila clavipes]|nr:hypothetical protein TNCV_2295001 [Trichonephila clavipes]
MVQLDHGTQSISSKRKANSIMKPPAACTVPCCQLESMASWVLPHTRVLPSVLTNWNWNSPGEATVLTLLGSNRCSQ